MFTGLVETIGRLDRRAQRGDQARAFIQTELSPLVLGESISVDGACLTVDRIAAGGFEADMSSETLARTTLGAIAIGSRVHLERATPAGGRLGGHMVLGHVDGVGRVSEASRVGSTVRLSVRAPADLARFIASKGSIAIQGVSLTVNEVRDAEGSAAFDVMLVPRTLASTLLGNLSSGDAVNLEVDVLARYVARVLDASSGVHGDAARREGADDARTDDERILTKLRAGGFA